MVHRGVRGLTRPQEPTRALGVAPPPDGTGSRSGRIIAERGASATVIVMMRTLLRRSMALGLSCGIALAGSLAPAAPAGASTAALQVSVSATSAAGGGSSTGLVAGVMSPRTSGLSPGATASPFSFTAACGLQTPCGSGAQASWDFGDGTTATTTSLSTSHDYQAPGEYRLSVTVTDTSSSGTTYLGTASMEVLVSPRYGDVPVADPSASPPVSARSSAPAIWAVGALGLFSTCRADLPQVSGVSPSSVLEGEAQFCPAPLTTYGPHAPSQSSPPAPYSWLPTAPPVAGAAPDGTGNGPVNGATGAACLAAASNCNLPVDLFVAAGATSSGVCNPNPDNSGTTAATTACEKAAQVALEAEGLLSQSGDLVVTPTNCGTGYGLVDAGTYWTASPGVDAGCVSRGAFFKAVVVALDGPGTAGATSSVSGCSGSDAYYFARAAFLGLPDTTVTNASGTKGCDATAPLQKAAAYQVIASAAALPTPSACPSGLADMSGAPATDCSVIENGGPLVGNTSCPSGAGSCYNPAEPLTRSDVATLLASQLLGLPVGTYDLRLQLSGNHSPQPVDSPLAITATAKVPAWYASSGTVTLTWPSVGSGASLTCPTSGPQSVGTAHEVTETCTYQAIHAGSASLAVSASDSQGDAASATFALSIFNRSPEVASASSSSSTPTLTSTGGSSATAKIAVDDPYHQQLAYSLCPDGSSSATCGASAPVTYVSGAGSSSQGSVAIGTTTQPSGSGPGAATVTFTPNSDMVDGVYSFVLKACNPDLCSEGTVFGKILPITTATNQTVNVSSLSTTTTITLSGKSPSDDPITSYEIDSLPTQGTLLVNTSSTSTPNYVPAAVGITTSDANVEYQPNSGTTASADSFTFSTAGSQRPSTFSKPGTVSLTLP